jgi:predicted dehydrogenase
MRVGILGCGFVSEYYLGALAHHPDLTVAGVFDRDALRVQRASEVFGVPSYPSYARMLEDPGIDTIVNLTPPEAHLETSRAALEAGKHVFCEKPLTTELETARALAELARTRGRMLCSAPSTLLGPTAQALWQAVRRGAVGTPKLVYAELDDGPVHLKDHREWRGKLGVPWPHMSEFATAYYLTWVTAFFGPVRRVTAVSRCVYPDKQTDAPIPEMAPDLSIGLLEHASGVLTRLTCGLVAPTDHSLTVVGDAGVLAVRDGWNVNCPISWRRGTSPVNDWPDRHLAPAREYPLPSPRRKDVGYESSHAIDFAAGVADMAQAVAEGRPPRLAAQHALHVLEVTFALQHAGAGVSREIASEFPAPVPMPWAA